MNFKFLQSSLAVLFVAVLAYGFYSIQNDPNADYSPAANNEPTGYFSEADTTPPPGFPYPRRWNFAHTTSPVLSGGTVGSFYVGTKWVSNRWNSSQFYRMNATGENGGPALPIVDSNAAYVGQIRDMAVVGNNLWGGRAANILYKMDTLGNLVSQFSITGGNFRAICWDPNRKGFWNTNFAGNIVCHDTNGVVKGTITSALTGKYGLAFDTVTSVDTAYIWCWNQGTGVSELVQYRMNGTIKATYAFTNPGTGIAGGAEIQKFGNDHVLMLNFQNIASIAYTIKSGPAGGNTTLVLYHDSVTVNAGRKADRDTLNKYLPQLTAGYDTYTYTSTDTLPNLNAYRTIIIQETNNDGITLSAAARTKLKAWLSGGTAGNKRALLALGGDWGYNYDRTGAAGIDTALTRGLMGWIYKQDNATIAPYTIIGVGGYDGNATRTMSSTPPGGNYWPEGVTPTQGGITLYRHHNHTVADTVAAIGKNTAGYVVATLFQDPRFFVAGDVKPWLQAGIGYLKTNGGLITSIGGNEITSAPESYSLSQNYPNPFNPSTKISFSIPKNGLVSLKVYDMLGKEVATLVNDVKNAGAHTIEFNAANLPSGAYFYRLEAIGFVETKRMMLIK